MMARIHNEIARAQKCKRVGTATKRNSAYTPMFCPDAIQAKT